MDKAGSEQSIIALEGWLQTPAGVYLRAWEQTCLDNLTADIFGFNAVQIGMPQIDALAANRMPYKWLADRKVRPPQQQVTPAHGGPVIDAAPAPPLRPVALTLDYTELPFASQSMDLVCCRMCWNFPPTRVRCCAKSNAC